MDGAVRRRRVGARSGAASGARPLARTQPSPVIGRSPQARPPPSPSAPASASAARGRPLPYAAPMGSDVGVVLATLLASGVEFVEALTIVLAMGTTREWRSTWFGVGAALGVLAVVTALAGYALQSWLPEALLQLVVGTLLLIFGLQWLRKALLRSAGLKAL